MHYKAELINLNNSDSRIIEIEQANDLDHAASIAATMANSDETVRCVWLFDIAHEAKRRIQ